MSASFHQQRAVISLRFFSDAVADLFRKIAYFEPGYRQRHLALLANFCARNYTETSAG
jgi:hypothetical protein